ncbi:MAG: sigma-70 family RNA polymerase sigma factor [Nocardioides sp.]
MAAHLASLDGPPSDGELISAVRGGDTDAYGELFSRHVEAARRLARQLVSAGEADDLVSEAFAKVLVVLQRGGGPDLAFRAYLLTAVRRLQVDRIRSTTRLRTTDDLTPFDPGVPFRDTVLEGFESATAARAFASLPERWQLVLWHTEVEGHKPAEVAPLLGMSANSVSALAYRAREGLRQAYLSMHAQDVDDDACARTRAALGSYVRGGLSRRDAARVEQHLAECRACAAIHLELTEVNSRLGALLAPLLLGTAAAAYLGGSTGGAAAGGGIVLLLDRARDLALSHGPTAAVAGAAASAVAVGLLVITHQADPDLPIARDLPATRVAPADGSDARLERTRQRRGSPSTVASTRTADPDASATASPPPSTTPSTTAAVPPGQPPTTPPPSPGPSTTPSSTPPPPPTVPSAPEPRPLVRVDADVSVGPDGLAVGASAGALGLDLPPVQVTIPVGPG